jgi:2-phospho-L-lactate transferase/gluconeogenesis factor (CofD/UPF0052 family)
VHSDLTLIFVAFVSIIVGFFSRKLWARFTAAKIIYERNIMTDIDSLTYQYIVDAHILVIELVGLDPLRDPLLFQKHLLQNMEWIDIGIEELRAKYIESIFQTDFGKVLDECDVWRQKRNEWVEKKKKRLCKKSTWA